MKIIYLLGALLVLLSVTLPHVNSADTTKIDCSKPCWPGVDPQGVQSSCTTKQATKIVIEVNNNQTSKYYPFCVLVDELSELTLNGSSSFMNVSENSTVTVWVGSFASQPQYYRSMKSVSGRDAFTMYYTLGIQLSSGVLNSTSVTQPIKFIQNCDSANVSCSLDITMPCVRNAQCGMYYDQSTERQQDVKVFISWTGTDTTGTPLRSYGLLPSNFRFLAFENYFNEFVGLITPQ